MYLYRHSGGVWKPWTIITAKTRLHLSNSCYAQMLELTCTRRHGLCVHVHVHTQKASSLQKTADATWIMSRSGELLSHMLFIPPSQPRRSCLGEKRTSSNHSLIHCSWDTALSSGGMIMKKMEMNDPGRRLQKELQKGINPGTEYTKHAKYISCRP